MTRISVIGLGYLGTVHAAAMASLGHEVVGVDTDAARVDLLRAGEAPFFEPGLPELLQAGVSSGRLRFESDVSLAGTAEVHFVCVGTPQGEGATADLSAVFAVCEQLLPHLGVDSVVVGKSTVPVGTAGQLAERIAPTGGRLIWNPEFLREGQAVADSLRPDRIVLGVAPGDDAARARLEEVYATPLAEGVPLVVTDLATAELVKGAANAYLALRLSFMNALAGVADASGADVTRLAEALGHDARIGSRYLGAGIGFGGGCLPKDIRAFSARARELGADASAELLQRVDAINIGQRVRGVETVAEMLGGGVRGRRITVLGAAFKPDSDDVRDSPALDIAVDLHEQGARVTVTDPAAVEQASARYPQLSFERDLAAALRGAELVVLATEWWEYRELDPVSVGALVAGRLVFDGRNCLDSVGWKAAGWVYRGVGRR